MTGARAAAGRLAGLGPAGPDEMGRELAEGPAAVEGTLAEARRLAPDLAAAWEAAGRIVLLGTGASLAMSRAAEPVLRVAAARDRARPVLVRESSHAVLGAPDGEELRPDDLAIAVSQSGASPETVAAAHAARSAGARILAVTADGSSALASTADLVLVTPSGHEEGAATKSELAALAALLALAGALPTHPAAVAGLRGALEALVADTGGALPAGGVLGRARRAWIVGFGTGLGLAIATATLLHEKALLAAIATTPSEFRHGPIEVATSDDVVVLVETDAPDPRRDAYLGRLAAELGQIGTPLVVTGAMDVPPMAIALPAPAPTATRPRSGVPPPGRAGVAGGPAPDAAILLTTLLRLQQAARVAAHARGTYRDGFRILRDIVLAADLAGAP